MCLDRATANLVCVIPDRATANLVCVFYMDAPAWSFMAHPVFKFFFFNNKCK